jgi:hypothetical protein
MTVTTFGSGGTSIPSLTQNAGKYLSTNGSTLLWNSVPKGIDLIQNQTFTSAQTVTFSNIPQTYNHLKVIGNVNHGNGATVSFTTNGFSNNSSGYIWHNGGATWSGSTSSTHYVVPYMYGGAGSFELTIPAYTTMNNKAWHCISGSQGTSYSVGISGGNFSSGAISTLTLSGNNSGYWNVSLYGMD